MGFFSKKLRGAEAKPAFPRTVLRQALTLGDAYRGAIVIHLEAASESFLKFNSWDLSTLQGSNWTELRLSSSAEGDLEMTKILERPAYITTLFEEAESSSIDFESAEDWTEKYGFSSFFTDFTFDQILQMAYGELEFPSDDESDELSYGNFLSKQLSDPNYFPNSLEEISLFWGYLNESTMQVGMFGNFKNVLKSLTNRFDQVLQGGNREVISALAGCLGSGYGQIEAYLSKGNISPSSFLHGHQPEMLMLSDLPEFGGNFYPSLKTAQYLSRRGLRLFKKIEQECDSLSQTRFRVNLLNIADLYDERSSRFPEYQVLVDYLVHGQSEPNARDRSGRKLEAVDYASRESIGTSADFVARLTDEDREVYSIWIPEIEANNPVITRFGFELSAALNINFAWGENSIRALSSVSSALVQEALVREISRDVSKFFFLAAEQHVRFLRLLDTDSIEKILSSKHYSLRNLANEWARDCSQRELSIEDIRTSKALLSGQRGRFSADALLALIVNLSKHSQLKPIEDWGPLISLENQTIYSVSTQDFLAYLGADNSGQGVFDVLKSPDHEVIKFFASEVIDHVEWSSQERINEVMSAILQSNSSSLQSVGLLIVRKQLLGLDETKSLLEFLNRPDLQFAIVSDLIAENDQEGLLAQFVRLSAGKERVFWRKHSTELEAVLKSWPDFPKFIWSNLEKLPEFVRETLLAYEWLGAKLLSIVTPGAVSKLSQTHAEIFVDLLKKHRSALENDSLLRAVLAAPSAKVNEFGAQHLKQVDRYSEFWLVMLESNLPVTTEAAYNFLEGQSQAANFADMLLMALDSNNKNARTLALQLLREKANRKLIEQLVHKLAESKSTDVWSVVRQNLELVKNQSELRQFTRQVFLSRRQARAEKERIKEQLSKIVTSISEAVESEILLRMTFSSVAKDREWALKQIALGHLATNDVVVEETWRGPVNV